MDTVAAEKLADLVLLDANPLEDIRNTSKIDTVILDGRLYDRSDLNALLARAEEAANTAGSPVIRPESSQPEITCRLSFAAVH